MGGGKQAQLYTAHAQVELEIFGEICVKHPNRGASGRIKLWGKSREFCLCWKHSGVFCEKMWLIRRSLGKISGFKRIPIKWRLTWTRRGYKYHTKRPSQSAWQVWPPLPSGQACNEQPWNEACCSVRTRPAGSRALLFWDELTWCISLIAGYAHLPSGLIRVQSRLYKCHPLIISIIFLVLSFKLIWRLFSQRHFDVEEETTFMLKKNL